MGVPSPPTPLVTTISSRVRPPEDYRPLCRDEVPAGLGNEPRADRPVLFAPERGALSASRVGSVIEQCLCSISRTTPPPRPPSPPSVPHRENFSRRNDRPGPAVRLALHHRSIVTCRHCRTLPTASVRVRACGPTRSSAAARGHPFRGRAGVTGRAVRVQCRSWPPPCRPRSRTARAVPGRALAGSEPSRSLP